MFPSAPTSQPKLLAPPTKVDKFPGVEFKAPKGFKIEDVADELNELDDMNFNEFSNDRKPSYIQKCQPRPPVRQDK
jgi:hypothetical protein